MQRGNSSFFSRHRFEEELLRGVAKTSSWRPFCNPRMPLFLEQDHLREALKYKKVGKIEG